MWCMRPTTGALALAADQMRISAETMWHSYKSFLKPLISQALSMRAVGTGSFPKTSILAGSPIRALMSLLSWSMPTHHVIARTTSHFISMMGTLASSLARIYWYAKMCSSTSPSLRSKNLSRSYPDSNTRSSLMTSARTTIPRSCLHKAGRLICERIHLILIVRLFLRFKKTAQNLGG